MPQPKDTDWLNGVQDIYTYIYTHTHTHTVYNGPILDLGHRLKVRGWKKVFHANTNQKKAGVAILLSDKMDFKDCYKKQRRTLHND